MVFAVFLLAFLLSIALLYFVHSRPWYLHTLAVLAALALGFMPAQEQLKGKVYDLAFGGVIIFLLVWGIGGLLTLRVAHREKHA